jgi:TolB-like protein
MRQLTAVLLVASLTSCANWCDCANQQAAEPQATVANSAAANSSESSVDALGANDAIDSEGQTLYTRPMREAPPVYGSSQPSQLDLLASDPNAQPLNLDRNFVRANAQPQLKRKMLPSEVVQAQQLGAALSPYPELQHSKKQLSDYAQQMAFKLINFQAIKGARVGVASFVEFDESLRATTPLGNQFAEALATLLPQYGVDIIEYKLTKNLSVGVEGDLAMSRQVSDLHDEVGMDYILTGTLVTTKRGVQVNSRVVSVNDHRVVASASTLLPHLVLQQIQP